MDAALIPRIAEDQDFVAMKRLIDDDDGWTMELSKSVAKVWTRTVEGCNFNMVRMNATFDNIPPDVVYDVLLDPDYRRDWDSNMLASVDIGCLNVNNDIGYYAMSCPAPLKPRDFVLMRSWLDTHGEQMLISRSVTHKDWPPKKGFVRAMSYITGFVLRPMANGGCLVGYIAHCDPQGTLPPWLVNKVTHSLGPRMVKDLLKASMGYVSWKAKQPHNRKPWRNPEEIVCPRISIEDCITRTEQLKSSTSSDSHMSTHESSLAEDPAAKNSNGSKSSKESALNGTTKAQRTPMREGSRKGLFSR